jgi:ethanolamine utilization protein EutQ (cupin superfamily)
MERITKVMNEKQGRFCICTNGKIQKQTKDGVEFVDCPKCKTNVRAKILTKG